MDKTTNVILYHFPVALEEAVDFDNNSSLIADSFSDEFLSAQNYLEFLKRLLEESYNQFRKKLIVTTTYSKSNEALLVLVWDAKDELNFFQDNQDNLKAIVDQHIAEFEDSAVFLLQEVDNASSKGLDKDVEKQYRKMRKTLGKDPAKAIEEYVEFCEDLEVDYSKGLDLAEKINRNPKKVIGGIDYRDFDQVSDFEVLNLGRSKAEIRLLGKDNVECSIKPENLYDWFNLSILLRLKKTGQIHLLSLEELNSPKFTRATVINFHANSIKFEMPIEEIENLTKLLESFELQTSKGLF